VDAVGFLADTGIFPSRGEARKTIQGGGVSMNKEKISDISLMVNQDHLIAEKYILIQKGKKHYYLVVCG
jgi:tyrosyl-tRNA synthetase